MPAVVGIVYALRATAGNWVAASANRQTCLAAQSTRILHMMLLCSLVVQLMLPVQIFLQLPATWKNFHTTVTRCALLHAGGPEDRETVEHHK